MPAALLNSGKMPAHDPVSSGVEVACRIKKEANQEADKQKSLPINWGGFA
jgi:hypothetical protein